MTLGQNIKFLRQARGWTLADLSSQSGVDVGTISALEVRGSQRSKYAAAIARAFGVTLEELVESTVPHAGEQLPPDYGKAQDLSHPTLTVVPVVPWDDLMSANLPPRFEIAMPDESMEPRIRPGNLITFSRDEKPRPGDGVLVRDAAGSYYVRVYRRRTATAWEAHAANLAFAPLDSERDGLSVAAVLVGVPARWG